MAGEGSENTRQKLGHEDPGRTSKQSPSHFISVVKIRTKKPQEIQLRNYL